jgi:hypothetical protein
MSSLTIFIIAQSRAARVWDPDREQVGQDRRCDLPREAELVLEPAALARGAPAISASQ